MTSAAIMLISAFIGTGATMVQDVAPNPVEVYLQPPGLLFQIPPGFYPRAINPPTERLVLNEFSLSLLMPDVMPSPQADYLGLYVRLPDGSFDLSGNRFIAFADGIEYDENNRYLQLKEVSKNILSRYPQGTFDEQNVPGGIAFLRRGDSNDYSYYSLGFELDNHHHAQTFLQCSHSSNHCRGSVYMPEVKIRYHIRFPNLMPLQVSTSVYSISNLISSWIR